MLIIYDNTGRIFVQNSGDGPVPQGGIQYLETEIPNGKIATRIDISTTPHKPILEDMPKTEIEKLQEKVYNLELANTELTNIVAMGNTNV